MTKHLQKKIRWLAASVFTVFFIGNIQKAHAVDMGAMYLVHPDPFWESPMCPTVLSTITIRIINYDVVPIDFAANNVFVVAWISGPISPMYPPFVTLNSGTLAAGAFMDVDVPSDFFTPAADLSISGVYTFYPYANVSGGDANNLNNGGEPALITVLPSPVATTGPAVSICKGASTLIGAAPVAGNTYLWTPATGLSSGTSANPTASPAVTTTYSLTERITSTGCTKTNTVVVTVTPLLPVVDLGADVTQCGGAVLLDAGNSGASYAWSNLATTQTINVSSSGTYSIDVTNSCGTVSDTVTIIINPVPSVTTAGSNSTVCAGAILNLTAGSIAGATYLWTGPNAFSSALQNPSIMGATVAATGTYSVTATVAGCTGAAGTTAVVVNAIPVAPAAGSNSPICVGSALNLTASAIAGATYSWTGPNSFISSLKDTSISGATALASGTYSVTATVGGCTGAAGTVAVVVNLCTGVPVISNEQFLIVYPNPTTGEITLTTEEKGVFTAGITNAQGKEVVRKSFEKEIKLTLPNAAKGIYTVKVCDAKGTVCHSEKIVLE